MKKILGFLLSLVMLVSVLAVMPLAADGDAQISDYAVYLDDGVHLLFTFTGDKAPVYVPVAAKEMGDLKGPEGYDANYSVLKYATALLANSTAPDYTKAIVTAMLNYGAAAQNYFEYKTDSLVGTPVTDTTDLIEATAPEVAVDDEAGIYIGATLVLEGTMQLRFYFAGSGLEAEYDNNTQTATNKDGYCYFDVPVMPYKMAESVIVTVGNTTVTYAPINYLQAKAEDAELSEMVASIYAYGVAASNYYRLASCEHEGIILEEIKVATLFTNGVVDRICPECGYTERGYSDKADVDAEYVITNDWDSSNRKFHNYIFLTELVSEDNHFYDEDKSLFIEFSVLVNDTMGTSLKDSNNKSWLLCATVGHTDGNDRKLSKSLWFHRDGNDSACPYIGGLEPDGSVSTFYDNDLVSKQNKYYVLDDYYGWHRFGFQLDQEHEIVEEDGEYSVEYTMYITLFIDGVKIMTIESDWKNKNGNLDNLLYFVEVDENGNPTFKDNDDENIEATAFVLEKFVPKGGNNIYLPVADTYITLGTDFVVDVTYAENPIEGTYVCQDGTVLDADRHFNVVGNDAICKHDGKLLGEVKSMTVPTIFSDGEISGVCSCGEVVTRTLPKTAIIVEELDDESGNVSMGYSASSVLMGDHFYPTEEDPDGKDLFIEMTMLWNPTLANIKVGYMDLGSSCTKGNGNRDISPYYLNFRDDISGQWCKFAGGFEPSTPGSDGIYDGPLMPDGGEESDYPFIGEYGWHRIGIRIHQDAIIDGDSVSYKVVATLYIDGDEVSSYHYNLNKTPNLLLFTAEVVDGKLEYSDIDEDATFLTYRISNGATDADEVAYFVLGDVSVTCGNGFVLPVTKLKTPTEGTYSPEDGVTLDGDVYFSYN